MVINAHVNEKFPHKKIKKWSIKIQKGPATLSSQLSWGHAYGLAHY